MTFFVFNKLSQMQGVKQHFSAITIYHFLLHIWKLAVPFKRNQLEHYYIQTCFHHLILIWIDMVCILRWKISEKEKDQPSTPPVIGCELHPVLSKGHAEGMRVSTPYSIHCLPLHGCTKYVSGSQRRCYGCQVSFCTLQKMAVTFARISCVQCFGVGICSSKYLKGFLLALHH